MTYKDALEKYKITIGIECHVQLKTKTKLFSGSSNQAREASPNTTVSPIDFGLPGTLPVLNQAAIDLAIKAGLALNSQIASVSRFERKHYFYPDLPKGYQMTQLAEPIILGGKVTPALPDGSSFTVRLHHAHLEEDAGKLTHPVGADYSLVDLNRAGTPLIEIVSEADIHTPAQARSYAEELHRLMTYAEVSDGDLYHGNMRFDVNLSLNKLNETKLGTRTETKNLNSFRAVEKAAEYEVIRQAEALDEGAKIVQETRGWDDGKQVTFSQRSKEDAHDYRYMPDPDVALVKVSQEQINKAKQNMPPMPGAYRAKWQELGLDESVVRVLLSSRQTAELVSRVQDLDVTEATKVANWFASGVEDVTRLNLSQTNAKDLANLAKMTIAGEVSSTGAKQVFNQLISKGGQPDAIAKELNLLQTNDQAELAVIVDQVLADPAAKQAVDDVRNGQDKAIGFLVGQCMKLSKGSGNPAVFKQLLNAKLKGE